MEDAAYYKIVKEMMKIQINFIIMNLISKYPYNKAFFFAGSFMNRMSTADKLKKYHTKTEDI